MSRQIDETTPVELAYIEILSKDIKNIVYMPSSMFLKLPSDIFSVDDLIKNHSELYQRLPKYFMTEKNAEMAIDENAMNLAFVPEHLLIDHLIKKALIKEPLAIGFLGNNYRTNEYCLYCVLARPETLAFLDENQQSEFMVELAIDKKPLCIQYVCQKYLTYRLVKKAVISDNRAITVIPNELIDDDLIKHALDGEHFILDRLDKKNSKFINSSRINKSLENFPIETLLYLLNEKSTAIDDNFKYLVDLVDTYPHKLSEVHSFYFRDRRALLLNLIHERPELLEFINPNACDLEASIIAYQLNPRFDPVEYIKYSRVFLENTNYIKSFNFADAKNSKLKSDYLEVLISFAPDEDSLLALLEQFDDFSQLTHIQRVQEYLSQHRFEIHLALNPDEINQTNILTVNPRYLNTESISKIDLHVKDNDFAERLLQRSSIFFPLISHEMQTQERTLNAIKYYPEYLEKIPVDLLESDIFVKQLIIQNPMLINRIGKLTNIDLYID